LDAAVDTLEARVRGRGRDASDATEQVVQRQVEELSGDIAWHRLDARGTPQEVLQQARPLVGL
jgi:uncharacterized protein